MYKPAQPSSPTVQPPCSLLPYLTSTSAYDEILCQYVCYAEEDDYWREVDNPHYNAPIPDIPSPDTESDASVWPAWQKATSTARH